MQMLRLHAAVAAAVKVVLQFADPMGCCYVVLQSAAPAADLAASLELLTFAADSAADNLRLIRLRL